MRVGKILMLDPLSIASIALLSAAAFTLPGGIHRVPEGHVAVYWRGGALLKGIKGPGFHMMLPVVTHVANVQVTVQTDKVTNIPCGTAGGTVISFDRIEVVNQLHADAAWDIVKNYTVDYDKTWIYDKIHHEINQFCSKHTLQEVYISQFEQLDEALRDALQQDINRYAPGISIIAIRVTKPRIPESIKRNYEDIEAQRTKLQVAVEAQKLVEKEAETERKKALIEAEKVAAVERVGLERMLAQKKSDQTIQDIDNQMHIARAKAEADAEYYRNERDAQANQLRLTPEYLQLEYTRAIANNTKIYFGEKLPSFFLGDATFAGVSMQSKVPVAA